MSDKVANEFAEEMLAALAPFMAAAKRGVATYEAVKAADLHKNGLSSYVTVYVGAGSHAAESMVSYSDWERLAKLAQAIEARRAETPKSDSVADESVVGTADAPKGD